MPKTVIETIVDIPIVKLRSPKDNPFNIKDDIEMEQLTESIKKFGIREPCILRQTGGEDYVLLCGNRRKRACEILGIKTLPCIVRTLSDEMAILTMLDSNLLHREKILPSEKAWAYRLKMETLKQSGIKSGQYSFETLVNQTGESKNQIYRYVRLTELIPPLLDMVDCERISFNPAVELSYLSRTQQNTIVSVIEEFDIRPSLSQAVRLKKLKQSEELTENLIRKILSEEKRDTDSEQPTYIRLRKYYPPEYSPKEIEEVIINLLEEWRK